MFTIDSVYIIMGSSHIMQRGWSLIAMVELCDSQHLDAWNKQPVWRRVGQLFLNFLWGGVTFCLLEDSQLSVRLEQVSGAGIQS